MVIPFFVAGMGLLDLEHTLLDVDVGGATGGRGHGGMVKVRLSVHEGVEGVIFIEVRTISMEKK